MNADISKFPRPFAVLYEAVIKDAGDGDEEAAKFVFSLPWCLADRNLAKKEGWMMTSNFKLWKAEKISQAAFEYDLLQCTVEDIPDTILGQKAKAALTMRKMTEHYKK